MYVTDTAPRLTPNVLAGLRDSDAGSAAEERQEERQVRHSVMRAPRQHIILQRPLVSVRYTVHSRHHNGRVGDSLPGCTINLVSRDTIYFCRKTIIDWQAGGVVFHVTSRYRQQWVL
jgi:hypothetical protein